MTNFRETTTATEEFEISFQALAKFILVIFTASESHKSDKRLTSGETMKSSTLLDIFIATF